MTTEKEKPFRDFIKMISPGMLLRTVIDDIIRSGLGAMIVLDTKELHAQNIIERGFRINSRLTAQKLFELCKMDGAVIISQNFKRILYANSLMTPDNSIYSIETGTRHKAAERTAKQAHTLVITVSEKKKKTTLYYNQSRYYLKPTDELIRGLSSTLQVLEKQREMLNEQLNNLNILEMSEMVSISDVCGVIQKTEMILKISESIKQNFIELGREGNIIHMRYRELIRGVEKTESEIIRDYATLSLKQSKTLLSNLTFEGLLDIKSIARLILEESTEKSISPKGFRFLAHLTLSEKENSLLVKQFKNLENLLKADISEFEPILKNRANTTKEEIRNLREQVLSGKVVC